MEREKIGRIVGIGLVCLVALLEGCFGCTPTGGFIGTARVVMDGDGVMHMVAPYWHHTGYSPNLGNTRYAELAGAEAVVVEMTDVQAEEIGRGGLVLDSGDHPVMLMNEMTMVRLVRLAPSGWEVIETEMGDVQTARTAVPWVGEDGVLRVTANDDDESLTRELVGPDIVEPGVLTHLPDGYAFSGQFTSRAGRDPVWLVRDTRAESELLVPARLDCTVECTWDVDEASAFSPVAPSHRARLLTQSADGTPVLVESDAVADDTGEGWIMRIVVSWPGGRYEEPDIGPAEEMIGLATRPTEGFVVALHERYDDRPITLLVFDGDFEVTRSEVEVQWDVRESLAVIAGDGVEGELVHILAPHGDSIALYTVVLATGEQRVTDWELR